MSHTSWIIKIFSIVVTVNLVSFTLSNEEMKKKSSKNRRQLIWVFWWLVVGGKSQWTFILLVLQKAADGSAQTFQQSDSRTSGMSRIVALPSSNIDERNWNVERKERTREKYIHKTYSQFQYNEIYVKSHTARC